MSHSLPRFLVTDVEGSTHESLFLLIQQLVLHQQVKHVLELVFRVSHADFLAQDPVQHHGDRFCHDVKYEYEDVDEPYCIRSNAQPIPRTDALRYYLTKNHDQDCTSKETNES